MKPTAVLFTVILLVTGCITKDKRETYIPDDVLPEIPQKKQDTTLLPTPAHKEADSAKTVKVKYTSPYIRRELIKEEVAPDCGGLLMPPPEEEHSDTMVWRNVEIEAEYPGGAAAWQRFLNRNLRVPEEAIENDVQGTAVVQFVVDVDGSVSNVEAVSGPEVLCEAMVQVIKKSGKWVPAVQGGRQVKSLKLQPICIHYEIEE